MSNEPDPLDNAPATWTAPAVVIPSCGPTHDVPLWYHHWRPFEPPDARCDISQLVSLVMLRRRKSQTVDAPATITPLLPMTVSAATVGSVNCVVPPTTRSSSIVT